MLVGLSVWLLLASSSGISPAFGAGPPARPWQISKNHYVPPALKGEVGERIVQIRNNKWDETSAQLAYAARFRPEEIFRNSGIPLTLIGLGFEESKFKPEAQNGNALGVWQLQPYTAKRFGLKISKKVDERRDVILSTKCAARYLRHLYQIFGDWGCVAIAYKMGEGNLRKRLAETKARSVEELIRKKILLPETEAYLTGVFAKGFAYASYIENPK